MSSSAALRDATPAAATDCYHCGEAVSAGADFALEIDGELRPMCCPGCRAVAGLIRDSGMSRFYTRRTAYSERPAAVPDAQDFAVYDDPALAARFSTTRHDGSREVSLLIGGVTCAACTWLIENSLARAGAVRRANVNLRLSRLDVELEPGGSISELFSRVADLGYRVRPWHAALGREQARAEQRRDLRRLAVAGLGMMQVGMFAIALHAGALQGISEEFRDLLRYVSMAVSGFVVVFSARSFFESAWRHLRRGALVMDLPVALAIGLAWGASAVATITGSGDVYFDSTVMFTFLLLLARYTESRLRLRDMLAWQDAELLLPDAALCRRGEHWRTVPRESVAVGERVRVRAGDVVPVDGRVIRGASTVREESFSGEALGRAVVAGDRVYAGTVNVDAALELTTLAAHAETRLAALQRSVERSQREKPATARAADRIAAHFIAAVLLLAAVTVLAWLYVDPARAVWSTIAVLVISCPCALSLATPAALASASAVLRRQGILPHGEHALEALPRCTHVLFDKTGTLTSGALRLEHVMTLSPHWSADEVRAAAAALQRHANHPVATAFRTFDADTPVADAVQTVGAGVAGRYRDEALRIGSPAFLAEWHPGAQPPTDEHCYWIGLATERELVAWLGLADDTRREAATVVDALRSRGLRVELLTGDASARAAALGRDLGFDAVSIGQSPQDKLARVAALQRGGARVAMVGDGLNDAPVLGLADVSIAVTNAADLAKAQADVVLERGDLLQLLALWRTAARTRHIVRQNLAWALAYNALGIPLAALGLVPPWAAAIGMPLSSLLVVGNSLRLRHGGEA